MADARDPTVPASQDPAVPSGAGGVPPKRGMSTGVKVAIGCGILAALIVLGVVIMTVVGGMFVKNKAEQLSGGLEAQQEASQTIQELEREHPFTPPAGGVLTEELAEKFLAVTDDAWERMGEEMDEVAQRGERIEDRGGQAGLGDAMAGLQALGRSRVALAEALDENEMPVSAYLWTGLALMRAYEALDLPPEQSGLPPQNLELAARHRSELAEIADEDGDDRPDKGVVLGMAWTWAMSEGALPQTLGWDTLGQYAPSE